MTKDETLRVAAEAVAVELYADGTRRSPAADKLSAAVLEAVGFFRLESQYNQRRSEAEDALRGLTPGGSEFQTTAECVAYVRGLFAELHQARLDRVRYERLKRAINENCAGCSDACDKHGHAEDCGLTDWARSMSIQQRTIDRLEGQRSELMLSLGRLRWRAEWWLDGEGDSAAMANEMLAEAKKHDAPKVQA